MRRVVGMDIHRTFGEVVIWENGVLRHAGRVDMTRTALEGLGNRLAATDEVVIEATGNSMAVSRVLTPFVVHPAAYTYKLPDQVSFAEGAMVEPFAVGMQAAHKALSKHTSLGAAQAAAASSPEAQSQLIAEEVVRILREEADAEQS